MKTKIEEMARSYESINREKHRDQPDSTISNNAFLAGYNAAIQEAIRDFESHLLTINDPALFSYSDKMTLLGVWQAARLSAAKELAELREEIKRLNIEIEEWKKIERNQQGLD